MIGPKQDTNPVRQTPNPTSLCPTSKSDESKFHLPITPALPPAAHIICLLDWLLSVPVTVLGRHLEVWASPVSCGLQGHLGFIFRGPHSDSWGSLYRSSDSQTVPGLSCSVWPPCLASFIPSKLSPCGWQGQVLLPPQVGASGFALRPPYCWTVTQQVFLQWHW